MLNKPDGKKRTIIWKNSSMPINQATQIAKKNHGEDKTTIWKCATILRMKRYHLKVHNFDINIETLSGADIIHHTYGICYQNIMPSEYSQFDFDVETNSFVNMPVERKFKKVPLESKQEHLEPYYKKPKLSNFVATEFALYQPCPNYKK